MSMNGAPRAALSELLRKTVEIGGSDLHLRVDSPPQVRVNGLLAPLDGCETLTPETARQLCCSFLSDEQQKQFDKRKDIDFSIGVEDVSRFRVNIFNQKDTVGGVFRVIPSLI